MHCCLSHLFNNARLAPRRMKEEEVEGDKSVSGESSKSQEAVKKDVNKMNIKELKVWALRWVGKKLSWKAGRPNRHVVKYRRCSNVFFLPFTVISVMVWAGSGWESGPGAWGPQEGTGPSGGLDLRIRKKPENIANTMTFKQIFSKNFCFLLTFQQRKTIKTLGFLVTCRCNFCHWSLPRWRRWC